MKALKTQRSLRHAGWCSGALHEVLLKFHPERSEWALAIPLVLSLLAFMGCDLLNAPLKRDYYKAIDQEIAWAHATKLTVHISYDQGWGTSNPSMGQITPARDIRQGYDFDIEFTPDAAYTLTEWRAFAGELPVGWSEDLDQFEIDIQGRELEAGKDFVLMSPLSPRGGSNTLKINATGTITLVPWCRTEPRITRTEPRFTSSADLPEFSRGMVLSLYFNSPLKEASVRTGISIWNNTDNVDYSSRYRVEYFDAAGYQVVTLTPNTDNLPELDKIIAVTIKTGENGIENIQGEWMTGSDIVYTWKTLNMTGGTVTVFGAAYNSDNTITVSPWTITGDFSKVDVSYRVNRGERIPLPDDCTIRNVEKPNDSAVSQGTGVSGVQEYEIIFDIYVGPLIEESKSYKIWNIPGMSVSETPAGNNTVLLTQSTFAPSTFATAGVINFILTEDVVLGQPPSSAWVPVALNGKFYGNGHTITVSNGFDAAYTGAAYGIFSRVEGATAEIRDLTVNYAASASIANSAVTHIGGLAGYAGGGATLRNIIVRGAYNTALSYSGSSAPRCGGILGELSGAGTLLDTVYASLDLRLASSAADHAVSNVRIGGVAGYLENATISACVWAEGATLAVTRCDGRLYAGGIAGKFYSNTGTNYDEAPAIRETMSRGSIAVNADHHLHLGGLVGQASGAETAFSSLTNSVFSGSIVATSTGTALEGGDAYRSPVTNIGGLAGTFGRPARLIDGGNRIDYIDGTTGEKGPGMNGCGVNAAGIAVSYMGNGHLNLGGLAGYVNATNISNISAKCPLTLLEASNSRYNNTGGFIGFYYISSNTTISNCNTGTSLNILAKDGNFGGFIGSAFHEIDGTGQLTISQCSASGDVFLKTVNNSYCGGFAGSLSYATIEKCRASGSVRAQAVPGSSTPVFQLYAGGFIGVANSSFTLKNSYALGNVDVDDPYALRSNAYAGGLIGSAGNILALKAIENCFARGSVTVQAAGGNLTRILAGGLIGLGEPYSSSPSLMNNCVALGEIVIAKGETSDISVTLRLARVYAQSAVVHSGIANYALKVMYMETWDAYRYGTPTPITANPNPTGLDGEDVTMSELITWAWWNGTAGFTTENGWSKLGIERGYPRLAWEFE